MTTYGCRHLGKTLHFHPHLITTCCSNADGLVFGEKVEDLTYENIKEKCQNLIQLFRQGIVPDYCKNCFELRENYEFSEPYDISFSTFYISNWLHCNANCTYCVHNCLKDENNPTTDIIQKSKNYDILPVLKMLKKENLISKSPIAYITGGEPSLLKELPEVIDFLKECNCSYFQIYSSAILFNESIHNLLQSDIPTEIIISPDSGNRKLYEKIKRVDKFEQVISNIQHYLYKLNSPQNKVFVKYICIKDVNDNEQDVTEWLNLMKKIGVKDIRLDIDYNYPNVKNSVLPKLFEFTKQKAAEIGLNLTLTEMTLSTFNSNN